MFCFLRIQIWVTEKSQIRIRNTTFNQSLYFQPIIILSTNRYTFNQSLYFQPIIILSTNHYTFNQSLYFQPISKSIKFMNHSQFLFHTAIDLYPSQSINQSISKISIKPINNIHGSFSPITKTFLDLLNFIFKRESVLTCAIKTNS